MSMNQEIAVKVKALAALSSPGESAITDAQFEATLNEIVTTVVVIWMAALPALDD